MEEQEPSGVRAWWLHLSTEQRLAGGILSFCGLVAFSLALFQVSGQVRSPFLVPNQKSKLAQQFFTEQQTQANQLNDSKQKDTDHDGLSDYDESYVYHTSPYIGDSDSDGVPDTVEVAQNSDPNCPQGKTCFQAFNQLPQANASSSFSEFLDVAQLPVPQADAEIGQSGTGAIGVKTFLQAPPEPTSLTPTQIREYLVSNNLVAKDTLDGLSDIQVEQVYNAAYQEALKIRAAAGSSQILNQVGNIPGPLPNLDSDE
ncbi:hypothetical protein EXS71_00175 [Candidatus Uhrbacteria bacterium]|nr:hypothetical protein [Candidatus Uhrbacteria bacterium]